MYDNAKQFLKENGLDKLPRIDGNYAKFRGKYVFMLHDYAPISQSILHGGSGRIGVKRMENFWSLVANGARVVDGIFISTPWSIEGPFQGRLGEPKKIDTNYVIYTMKAIKNDDWIDVPHGFVKDPYDKTFMKHMRDGDRATLENIIIHERDKEGWWDFNERKKWWDYEQSKIKSAKLLDGFDVFVWATTLLDVDPKAALNLLRYASTKMPCFLDSGFEHYYDDNSQREPYIPNKVRVTVYRGTDIVDQSR